MESQGCKDGFLAGGGAAGAGGGGLGFAILRHERSRPGAETHWDLLLEVPGREGLVTFQIHRPPEEWVGVIVAQRLADHRRIYLTYEGEISGGRGEVRRWDGGVLEIGSFAGTAIRARIRGQKIRADLTGRGDEPSGRWRLRLVNLD